MELSFFTSKKTEGVNVKHVLSGDRFTPEGSIYRQLSGGGGGGGKQQQDGPKTAAAANAQAARSNTVFEEPDFYT